MNQGSMERVLPEGHGKLAKVRGRSGQKMPTADEQAWRRRQKGGRAGLRAQVATTTCRLDTKPGLRPARNSSRITSHEHHFLFR